MKMTPEMRKAQDNMAPGIITGDGFLGDDTRPLQDIIVEDHETMVHLGINLDLVIPLIHRLIEAGKKGLGEPITIEKWVIQIRDARGYLACPYEDGIEGKLTAVITNKSTGESLLVTSLSLHLLEHHGFLEGKGSPFRLDPAKMKDILEL